MNDVAPQISLAATTSTDYIYNAAMELVSTSSGGPHYFISNALVAEGINFTTACAPHCDVEIIRKDDNEFGRLRGEVMPRTILFEKISAPYVIISSVYNEIKFDTAAEYAGKIILDVQGFVRMRGEFGAKKNWNGPNYLREKLWVVKANEIELKFLDADFIEEQKKRILIITHGSAGCELFFHGEKFELVPLKKINSPHTVGAGDTLLGYFCAHLIQNNNPLSALQYAMARTTEFLEQII